MSICLGVRIYTRITFDSRGPCHEWLMGLNPPYFLISRNCTYPAFTLSQNRNDVVSLLNSMRQSLKSELYDHLPFGLGCCCCCCCMPFINCSCAICWIRATCCCWLIPNMAENDYVWVKFVSQWSYNLKHITYSITLQTTQRACAWSGVERFWNENDVVMKLNW